MGRPPKMPADAPDSWSVYFLVADMEAKMAATRDSGGSVCHGPEAVPGVGLIGVLMHPAGGVFSLMQPTG